jgi:hypothetical protein
VADKNTRKGIRRTAASTAAIDPEQTCRCMTRPEGPQRKLIRPTLVILDPSCAGSTRASIKKAFKPVMTAAAGIRTVQRPPPQRLFHRFHAPAPGLYVIVTLGLQCQTQGACGPIAAVSAIRPGGY